MPQGAEAESKRRFGCGDNRFTSAMTKEINELLSEYDPLGVALVSPSAVRGEYWDTSVHIAQMINNGRTIAEIRSYLDHLFAMTNNGEEIAAFSAFLKELQNLMIE